MYNYKGELKIGTRVVAKDAEIEIVEIKAFGFTMYEGQLIVKKDKILNVDFKKSKVKFITQDGTSFNLLFEPRIKINQEDIPQAVYRISAIR